MQSLIFTACIVSGRYYIWTTLDIKGTAAHIVHASDMRYNCLT